MRSIIYHPIFKAISGYGNRVPFLIILMLVNTLTDGLSVLLLLPILQGAVNGSSSEMSNQILKQVVTFFDEVAVSMFPNGDKIVVLSIALLVIFLTKTAFSIWTNKLITQFPWEWAEGKRATMMRAYMESNYSYFIKQKPGNLMSTITTVSDLGALCIQNFFSLVSNSLIALFFITLLFVMNGWISMVVILIAVIVLLLAAKFIHFSSEEAGKRRVQLNNEVWNEATQNLAGMMKIWILRLEESKLKYFESLLKKLSSLNAREFFKQKVPAAVLPTLITLILIISILYLKLFTTVDIGAQIPIIAIFLIISNRLFVIFSSLASNYIGFIMNLPNIENIEKTLTNFKSEKRDNSGHQLSAIKKAIKFEKVSFTYPGNKSLFEDLIIEFPFRKTSLIIGETGSGKSTLINLLLGFLRPNHGAILINDKDASTYNHKDILSKIGYLSQDIFLFNDTIIKNLQYSNPKASVFEMTQALDKAGFNINSDKFPEGYDTLVGEKGIRLSGGEKQRIAIASCFLQDPEVLIFDEPTSALDHETESIIIDSLKLLRGKKTIIIVSHNNNFSEFSDKIFAINDINEGLSVIL